MKLNTMIYICQLNIKLKIKNFSGDVIPFDKYIYHNIEPSSCWSFFKLPENNDKTYKLLEKHDYAFVHTSYSLGTIINIDMIENILKISKDTTLIIDPNINHYPKNHTFYNLANKFIEFQYILDYVNVMKNAKYILITDSSFFMLGSQLELKCENPYVYLRKRTKQFKMRYIDFINHKYLEKTLKRPKFTVI